VVFCLFQADPTQTSRSTFVSDLDWPRFWCKECAMANKAPNSNSKPQRAAESPADLRNNSAVSSRISTVSETAVLIRYDQQPEQADPLLLDKLYGRISWRLMPLFLVVMILNHVDRTNLAYACKFAWYHDVCAV
jgi:hypothetical protein